DLQVAFIVVPNVIDHGDELSINGALDERGIDQGQHFSGAGLAYGAGAQDAAHQRGVKRRRRALAADIADGNGGASAGVGNELIDIAADNLRRIEAGSQLAALQYRNLLRQHAELQLARYGELTLQPLLLAGNVLIETSVLDGDGDLRRQSSERLAVVVGEIAAARVLQIE